MIENITKLSRSVDKDHGVEDEPRNQGSTVPTLRTRLFFRRVMEECLHSWRIVEVCGSSMDLHGQGSPRR